MGMPPPVPAVHCCIGYPEREGYLRVGGSVGVEGVFDRHRHKIKHLLHTLH